MIDTIKLMFEEGQYQNRNYNFNLSFMRGKMRRGVLNPTAADKRDGIYMPRLTLLEQPNNGVRRKILTVEFSAPKLLLGDNFQELGDDDLDDVCSALRTALSRVYIYVSPQAVREARVVSVHYSKNLKLHGGFDSKYVIEKLRKANITRWYDRKTTQFDNGISYQIHTNTKDICLYDKVADLEKSIMSEKRSLENDNWIQRKLLESASHDILRFEVRLNTAKQVKREFGGDQILEHIFHWRIAQLTLIKYWNVIARDLECAYDEPEGMLNLLESVVPQITGKGLQSKLALVAVLYVCKEAGITDAKRSLKRLFGNHAWGRVKTALELRQNDKPNLLLDIKRQLDAFVRIRPDDLTKSDE